MTRSRVNESDSDQDQEVKGKKRYHFELSFARLFLYGFGLVVVLSWMFAFGILVGRGIPLVDTKDFSLRAELFRFLGLGKEVAPPPENVAETWENSKKMLESLNYYEDLAQKGSPSGAAKPGTAAPPAAAPAPKESPAEPSKQKAKAGPSAAGQPAAESAPSPPEKVSSAPAPQEAGPSDAVGEHFTLLIASLRDVDNAQRIVDQLRNKGYTPRLEALDLKGSGRWNRVLVGAFQTREEATRFAAEFNRKERMEALVIREVH